MRKEYTFILTAGDTGTPRECRPVYKDDLAVEYKHESGEQFMRASLSGSLSFVRDDFGFIDSQPFDTEFKLRVTDRSGAEVFRGKFFKTDCEFDIDNRVAEVEAEVDDEYGDIIAGMEDEYDLLRLKPEMCRVALQKRPLLQLYIPGDDIITCYLSGMSWEQDATATESFGDLTGKYLFSLSDMLKEVTVTAEGGAPAGASGLYTGRMTMRNDGGMTVWEGTMAAGADGAYTLTFQQYIIGSAWMFSAVATAAGSETPLYSFGLEAIGDVSLAGYDFEMTPAAGSGMSGSLQCHMATYNVFARYLCDVERFEHFDVDTAELPSDDIGGDNNHYRRAVGFAINTCHISRTFTDEPTEYGQAADGRYYAPPPSVFGKAYPLAPTTWGGASLWFVAPALDTFYDRDGRKDYMLRDTYDLASCINVLLGEIAPGITHEATEECSRFLYGRNPIDGREARLLITQKTNVTRGEYTQAAQKATVTLRAILDMLKNTYKCYWFVEDGKLKIEQVQFFRNGGSYEGSPGVGADLTRLRDVRGCKPWSFGTNRYSFDKVDMAERYEFTWMDDVSGAFEGEPVRVLSPYVTKGKKEDVNIGSFTTDIDFMMLNPSAITEDGFALFSAEQADAVQVYGYPPYITTSGSTGLSNPPVPVRTLFGGMSGTLVFTISGGGTGTITFLDGKGAELGTGGTYYADGGSKSAQVAIPAGTASLAFRCTGGAVNANVYSLKIDNAMQLPYYEARVDGTDLELQNGYMSFAYLHPAFWRYDMPARRLEINGAETAALSIEKKKKQEVSFPSGFGIDLSKLVRTGIGDGQIDEISIRLGSLYAEATLKYDTE